MQEIPSFSKLSRARPATFKTICAHTFRRDFLDQKHRRSAVRIGVLQFAADFKAEPWENPIQQPTRLKNLSRHLPSARLSPGDMKHDSTQDGSGNRSRFSDFSIAQSEPKPAPIIPPVMYF